jgi:hypothetical protein
MDTILLVQDVTLFIREERRHPNDRANLYEPAGTKR